MAIAATVESFWGLVEKSGLIPPGQLAEYSLNLESAGVCVAAPADLAQQMVADGLLTNFQSEQLLAGKYHGFTIGKYRILEQLGIGGMGAVYLAMHVHMHRYVAVKVLPPSRGQETGAVERFLREVQAAAALDHPNIARAIDADQDGKVRFLVMEYVDGANLQDIVSRHGPLSVPRALDYIRQSAVGLQHAHEHCLAHRDIKPGNLMLDRHGTIKILDMGLARFFDARADNLTRDLEGGHLMGTADYIAPEQAIDCHAADIRSDIYSLGFTGYFLLTGATPFHSGSMTQKLIWHQTKMPQSVRNVRTEIPEEVAVILRKMMEKNPADRYQIPWEVAEALAPWIPEQVPQPAEAEMPRYCAAIRGLGGRIAQPAADTTIIRASPITPVPRARGAPRTNTNRQQTAARSPQTNAATDKGPVRTPNPATTRTLKIFAAMSVVALLVLTVAGYLIWNAVAAIPKAANTPPNAGPPPAPPTPTAPALAAAEIRRFVGHTGPINRLDFSPDGRILATVGHDRTVRLWEVATGNELHRLEGHTDIIGWVAFAPDGKHVLSSSKDTSLRLWDVATGKEVRRFTGHVEPALGIAFAPDGKSFVSCSYDKTARLWDVATGSEIRRFTGHGAIVIAAAFAPDGRHVLTAGGDQVMRWWETDTGVEVRRLEGHAATVETVAISPDGRRAMAGGHDKIISLWDLQTGKIIRRFEGHGGIIWSVAFSPDGDYALSSGSSDQTIRLWNLATGKEVYCYRGHTALVGEAAFSPDGRFVGSCSHDRTVRLWDIPHAIIKP